MEKAGQELLKIIEELEKELFETKKDLDDLITYLAEHDIFISVQRTRALKSRLDEEKK